MGIAFLVEGEPSDLWAALHAVELAKRTGEMIHALQMKPELDTDDLAAAPSGDRSDEQIRQIMQLAVWLGQTEQIAVHCHVLGDHTLESLLAFLRSHAITSLVIGASDNDDRRKKRQWLNGVQQRLATDREWYQRVFWAMVTKPWDNETFERIVRHLQLPAVSRHCRPALPNIGPHPTSDAERTE